MSSTISISELQQQVSRSAQLVDVRSASEFASGHIPGAVNIPMDQIEARLDDLRPGVPIVLICQTGKRARMTAGMLDPCRLQISVLDGGTSAWIQAGLPVVTCVKTRWSLERQVRLVAGLLVLSGTALEVSGVHGAIWLALVVGAGLTFAGATDICMMAKLLARMPWNKARTNSTQASNPCCG